MVRYPDGRRRINNEIVSADRSRFIICGANFQLRRRYDNYDKRLASSASGETPNNSAEKFAVTPDDLLILDAFSNSEEKSCAFFFRRRFAFEELGNASGTTHKDRVRTGATRHKEH